MKRYKSIEISVVTIRRGDVIATSDRIETNDMGLRMYNEGFSGNSYQLIGEGED